VRPYNPYYTPQDPADYREYLSREFHNLKASMDQIHDLDVSSVPVEPPREGMIRYADGVNWDPLGFWAERGYGKGPYYYNGEYWLPMFDMPREEWAVALPSLYNVTGAWTTFLQLTVRPFFLTKLILTSSFECGGLSVNKLLDIGLRYRFNGQAISYDPVYGFSYNFGANTDQTTWHSVDMPLIIDTQNYISVVPGQTFYDVTVEVQALTNSVSQIDLGYIQVAEK
jgi:hypothetical protein